MYLFKGAKAKRHAATWLQEGAGFSLVELLVAMMLLTLVSLSMAQLIGFGVSVNRAAADITTASHLAADKLEELRGRGYANLVPGGSLVNSDTGFSDSLDVDLDGNNDITRRWQVVDLGTAKLIRVRGISTLSAYGPPKETTLALLVAQP